MRLHLLVNGGGLKTLANLIGLFLLLMYLSVQLKYWDLFMIMVTKRSMCVYVRKLNQTAYTER